VAAVSGPRHRPPLALRAVIAVVGVGALLFNAALMLADRAPGLLRDVGGDFVRRLFARIDTGGRGAELLDDPRLPESDAIVHFAVWAIAVVLVGWALWSWVGLFVGACAVAAASLVIEVGQGRWSDTRAVEASDAAANLAGVAAGTAFVVACYLAYSAICIALRRPARR